MGKVPHTQGPWFPISNGVGAYNPDEYASEGIAMVATCKKCDAPIISTAPEMFAAVKKLLAAFDELQSVTTAERIITGRSDAVLRRTSNEAMAELRAAVAKVEDCA